MEKESYRKEHTPPLTARIPFHYHRIPGLIRNLLAKILLLIISKTEQSIYPVDPFNPGCELILQVDGKQMENREPLVVLTHDIDTGDGLTRSLEIAEFEEEYGLRSLWNIVPKSYKLNQNVLHMLLERGHEIGLHGIWHTNQEAFLRKERMRKELSALNPFITEFNITGYRSPSWYRTSGMFDVLAEFFKYDLSCLDNDFICPGGNGGVGMIRPYAIRKNLLELPCTIPYEAPIFHGYSQQSLFEYWKPKIDWLIQVGGMLLVNTHPDLNYLGNDTVRESYNKLLRYFREHQIKWSLPGDLTLQYR